MNFIDAAIITPPFYSPMLPQLGPPVLKGFAQKHGCDFEHIDLNIAFHCHLRQKIDLKILCNPQHQQNLKEVEETLLLYFIDNFIFKLGSRPSYASIYLGARGSSGCIERYNVEVGSGLGLIGIVNSSADIIARFARDRGLNYYHQFLDETGYDEKIANKFGIVGFSILGSTQFIPTLTLASRLKELRPDIMLVLGGPWTTLFAQELAGTGKLHPFFDLIVAGEGELPFLEILKFSTAKDLGSIPNTWVKQDQGFAPPNSLYQVDMSDLEAPDYEGLDLDLYGAPKPVLLQTSRGCYWGRCAFCVHAFGVHDHVTKRVRVRPLELIAKDIEHVVKTYSPRFISFADVSISPVHMRRLCEVMIERGYKLPWFAFLRLDKGFDRNLLSLMRRAGCYKLNFGLESGSKEVLKTIDKGYDLTIAHRIIDDAIDLGFRVSLHTMAGLPREKRKDLEKTLDTLEHYAPKIHESYAEIFRLERSTRIFENPAFYGIQIHPGNKVFNNAISFSNLEGISSNEAMAMVDERLYPFFLNRNDIIFRSKSCFSLNHKDDFSSESQFKARFQLDFGEERFDDEVTVSTTGGGIFTKIPSNCNPKKCITSS